MEPVKPTAEHEWLQQLVGEWMFTGECVMGPDQPPLPSSGTESVHTLGGLWTVGQGNADYGKSIMTLGYDPVQQKFVGTFIASMMTHLWHYIGTLNESRTALVLDATGPSMVGDGGMSDYKDTIEFQNAQNRTLTSHMKLPDGQWVQFMKAHYKKI